jgi:hypothetical protein
MLNPDSTASWQRPCNHTGRRVVVDEADEEDAGEGRRAGRDGDGMAVRMASSDLFCQIKFNDEDMTVQAMDVVLVSPVHVVLPPSSLPATSSANGTLCPSSSSSSAMHDRMSGAVGAGIWLDNTMPGRHLVRSLAALAALAALPTHARMMT